jgi:NodT family efflux transporter outer membrane factor (OMF) lipoprotein
MVVFSATCAVGPNYVRPTAPVPPKYKELPPSQATTTGQWKEAQPSDAAQRGKWWELFREPELNGLEEQVAISNQSIAQAEAQFRGARALARVARASLFPSLGVGASVTRSSGVVQSSPKPTSGPPPTVMAYAVPVDLAWEADVFGGIRRNLEAGVASAQASAAQLEAVRLAIQAELAVDYFALRGVDGQRQLLDSTVAGYQAALQLTENQYKQGVVSGVDVAQAQTQLETTRAQATDLGVSRAQLEHAIAVLVGKPPGDFSLQAGPIRVVPVQVPVGVPSELLERRPDIAAAERLAAAANAQIGVAKAAYFPTFTLAASGGYGNSTLSNFFSLPNRFWSLGPALLETLFDGGRRRALSEQAWASYDAAVAVYRESVLTAFQDVEDNLAALRVLAVEAAQQADAVTASERSLTIAKNRYQGGITTYLEVVTAQSAALANERTAIDLLTRRMTASVNLIKALGGGWRESDLPDRRVTLERVVRPAAPTPAAPTPTAGPATGSSR